MAQNKAKTVSYRRDRDYSSHFIWTNELNQDLLECYRKAKENPSKGYMNRLKYGWDIQHPTLTNFTTKQLHNQAYNIEHKKSNNNLQNNTQSLGDIRNTDNNSNERKPIITDEQPNDSNSMITENTQEHNENNQEYQHLKESLVTSFNTYINIYKSLELNERHLTTRNKNSPSDSSLKAINDLADDYLNSLNDATLWGY